MNYLFGSFFLTSSECSRDRFASSPQLIKKAFALGRGVVKRCRRCSSMGTGFPLFAMCHDGLCHLDGLDFSPMCSTYFLSREAVISTKRIGMARWREGVFAFLLKDANSNVRFFNLPLNRVIELGTQVEI